MAERQGNPFEGVTDFFSEINRMRELGRQGHEHGQEDRQRTHATAWVPATDIFAKDGDLVMRIEVAGLRPDDVDITFSGGVLTVSGTRRTELGTGGENSFYIRSASTGRSGGPSRCRPTRTTTRSAPNSRTGWWRSPSRAAPQRASRGGSPSASDRAAPRRGSWDEGADDVRRARCPGRGVRRR